MFLQRVWGRVVEMALPSFSSVFLHQEDISIINEEKYSSQLDEFDISSLDLVYAEHNCGDPVDYILVEIFQLIIYYFCLLSIEIYL